MPRCEYKNNKLLIIKQINKMENTKKLRTKKQCDIHVVSSSNNFLIRQTSENEFIILKKYKEETTKGYLWWKKTISEEKYRRIDRYGNKFFCITYPIYFTNLSDIDTYKTLEDAKKWIENYNKYPIDYYY